MVLLVVLTRHYFVCEIVRLVSSIGATSQILPRPRYNTPCFICAFTPRTRNTANTDELYQDQK